MYNIGKNFYHKIKSTFSSIHYVGTLYIFFFFFKHIFMLLSTHTHINDIPKCYAILTYYIHVNVYSIKISKAT